MTANIKNISIALFFLAATAGVILGIWNGRIMAHSVNHTAENIDATTTEIREYVHTQRAQLETEREQKAIQAGIELGATGKGTLLLVNTKVVPRVMKLLDSLTGATDDLAAFTRHTDDSTNQTVLPAVAKMLNSGAEALDAFKGTAAQLGVSTKTMAEGASRFIEQTGTTVKDLTDKMNDPRFSKILDNALRFSDEGASTVGNVEAASEQLPEIADALKKIAQTTSRFSKAYWVARILGIVVPLVP